LDGWQIFSASRKITEIRLANEETNGRIKKMV
jgi:hypothetical protein